MRAEAQPTAAPAAAAHKPETQRRTRKTPQTSTTNKSSRGREEKRCRRTTNAAGRDDTNSPQPSKTAELSHRSETGEINSAESRDGEKSNNGETRHCSVERRTQSSGENANKESDLRRQAVEQSANSIRVTPLQVLWVLLSTIILCANTHHKSPTILSTSQTLSLKLYPPWQTHTLYTLSCGYNVTVCIFEPTTQSFHSLQGQSFQTTPSNSRFLHPTQHHQDPPT